MERIIDEVIRDHQGQVIATREFISEIIRRGTKQECITREVLQLNNGRVIYDNVLYRTKIGNDIECEVASFSMGDCK